MKGFGSGMDDAIAVEGSTSPEQEWDEKVDKKLKQKRSSRNERVARIA